ncbi:MAG: Nif3-like dinuclear metal center hexameric protein [Clostridiales bacterium]|jgi:dinuclear metal center YbgI/SA1388 family protein|nr:Nif3-like dinuclear metal center hexameric protein [Clostridiales bacterium]
MSVKMSQIMEAIERLAPLDIAEDWDNVGLLVGRRDAHVSKALIALDALDAVIDEAAAMGAQAIITHHPAIFKPIDRITDETPAGRRLLRLAEGGICLYAAHTNLDAADGGINDMLFDIFGLLNREFICEGRPGIFAGRAGILPVPRTLAGFAATVKDTLCLDAASYCGNGNDTVRKVGIIGGASANPAFFAGVLAAGCDTFITSDIKLSAAQAALDMGLSLVDATHYGSEAVFAQKLADYLRQNISGAEFVVSTVDGQPFKTVCIGGND